MDIIGGLTAARTAIGLAKDLQEIDRFADEASYKLKLADLQSALADTQVALADAKLKISELEGEVTSLKSGDLCPVCRSGRLQVVSVDPHKDFLGMEFHTVECNSQECQYGTKRQFDTYSLTYSS